MFPLVPWALAPRPNPLYQSGVNARRAVPLALAAICVWQAGSNELLKSRKACAPPYSIQFRSLSLSLFLLLFHRYAWILFQVVGMVHIILVYTTCETCILYSIVMLSNVF